MPFAVNFTVFNSFSIHSTLKSATFYPTNNIQPDMLQLSYKSSPVFYPYSGYFSLLFEILKPVNTTKILTGKIVLTFEFFDRIKLISEAAVQIPIKIKVIKTPDKSQRILFDQFHSINYPIAHIPIDDLSKTEVKSPLDWTGDSLLSNFQSLYLHLKTKGYQVETLLTEFCRFDASLYSSLLLIDLERNFTDVETIKLQDDVRNGLNLLVFADWYNDLVIQKLKFYDENARKWSKPVTGGSNIPAINKLIEFTGVKFSETTVTNSGGDFKIASGSAIDISNCKGKKCQSLQQKVSNLTKFYSDRKSFSENFLQTETILAAIEFDKNNGKVFLFADSDLIDDNSDDLDLKIIDVALDFVKTGDLSFSSSLKRKEPLLNYKFNHSKETCLSENNYFDDFQSMPFDYRKINDVMIILTDKYPALNYAEQIINKKNKSVSKQSSNPVLSSYRILEDNRYMQSKTETGYQFYMQVHVLLIVTVFIIWVFSQRSYSREIYLKPRLILRSQLREYTKL